METKDTQLYDGLTCDELVDLWNIIYPEPTLDKIDSFIELDGEIYSMQDLGINED